MATSTTPARPCRLFIVRHGERVDYVFEDWVQQCFDGNGQYRRVDLNLPATLPNRPTHHWAHDCPLTELGHWQARQVGRALADCEGVAITSVLSSPALRCVQTAAEIVSVLSSQPRFRIEPGLLEAGAWHGRALSDGQVFLDDANLVALGCPIDVTSKRLTSAPPSSEDIRAWYHRSDAVMRALLEQHLASHERGDLLVVAHGGSLDALTFGLRHPGYGSLPSELQQDATPDAQLKAFLARMNANKGSLSFCGLAQLLCERGTVSVVDTSGFSLTHQKNKQFVFAGGTS
eukprot:TRINITY_DN3611_c0_g1_i1.p1 TRINITY_DN3611_c0_g1~~TRINITY_DN3611_c0_g1_i1.p1  ORF type:complete len:296 (-),score=34.85 TRINITY_DN3611_c0_g1_i1:20-886(-)